MPKDPNDPNYFGSFDKPSNTARKEGYTDSSRQGNRAGWERFRNLKYDPKQAQVFFDALAAADEHRIPNETLTRHLGEFLEQARPEGGPSRSQSSSRSRYPPKRASTVPIPEPSRGPSFPDPRFTFRTGPSARSATFGPTHSTSSAIPIYDPYTKSYTFQTPVQSPQTTHSNFAPSCYTCASKSNLHPACTECLRSSHADYVTVCPPGESAPPKRKRQRGNSVRY